MNSVSSCQASFCGKAVCTFYEIPFVLFSTKAFAEFLTAEVVQMCLFHSLFLLRSSHVASHFFAISKRMNYISRGIRLKLCCLQIFVDRHWEIICHGILERFSYWCRAFVRFWFLFVIWPREINGTTYSVCVCVCWLWSSYCRPHLP